MDLVFEKGDLVRYKGKEWVVEWGVKSRFKDEWDTYLLLRKEGIFEYMKQGVKMWELKKENLIA